jgi:hypothetical protein
VIVTGPGFTAVTLPYRSTVAMAGFALRQLNVASRRSLLSAC